MKKLSLNGLLLAMIFLSVNGLAAPRIKPLTRIANVLMKPSKA
jgi:hypothetical protein